MFLSFVLVSLLFFFLREWGMKEGRKEGRCGSALYWIWSGLEGLRGEMR
jgi:hypothetical protein